MYVQSFGLSKWVQKNLLTTNTKTYILSGVWVRKLKKHDYLIIK